jgi:hypothetical protein
MPRRKLTVRNRNLSQIDIEALRQAIREGWPWITETADNRFRENFNLTIRQSIVLSYITGIAGSCAVYLAGEDHPSRETVAAVKAELNEDIAEAEKRFGPQFVGKRHSDSFFRCLKPNSPPRSEF